jgi:DNA-binding transcriptional ArsR family regulator
MDGGLRVVVQPGTGYELLLSALTVADRSAGRRLDAGTTWRKRAEAIDGGSVLRAFERIGGDPWISLMGLAHALTEDPTAANVVDAFARAEPRELVLSMCGYYRRAQRAATSPSVIRAAVDGDADAQRDFRRTSYPDLRRWQQTLRYVLSEPPEIIHREFVGALRRWHEDGFAPHEPDIAAAQATDAAIVRELVSTLELDAVLERIAPQMTFAREVGQSLVVLVPDVVIRPGFALTDHGPTLVIAYPAAGEAGDVASPPDRLVRMAKALADPIRLRALRELRTGPMTITELASRLGVPRTSLQHHVPLLIHAGLVSLSVDDARWGNLELRDEALGEVGRLTERYVLGRELGRAGWAHGSVPDARSGGGRQRTA